MMEDGSTTPALPWDRTSASWSPPGLPTHPEDNVPAPSGPAVSANATGIGPTSTHTHQHHQRTPGQPHRQLPRKTLLHQPLLAKRGPSTGMELPRAATQLRPPLPTDPEAGAVRGLAAGKLRDSTGLTWHTGQEGSCLRVTTGRCLGHEAGRWLRAQQCLKLWPAAEEQAASFRIWGMLMPPGKRKTPGTSLHPHPSVSAPMNATGTKGCP